jgi:hypothetical protein
LCFRNTNLRNDLSTQHQRFQESFTKKINKWRCPSDSFTFLTLFYRPVFLECLISHSESRSNRFEWFRRQSWHIKEIFILVFKIMVGELLKKFSYGILRSSFKNSYQSSMIKILESGILTKNSCWRLECVVFFELSQFISTAHEINNVMFVFSKNATISQPSNLFKSLKWKHSKIKEQYWITYLFFWFKNIIFILRTCSCCYWFFLQCFPFTLYDCLFPLTFFSFPFIVW